MAGAGVAAAGGAAAALVTGWLGRQQMREQSSLQLRLAQQQIEADRRGQRRQPQSAAYADLVGIVQDLTGRFMELTEAHGRQDVDGVREAFEAIRALRTPLQRSGALVTIEGPEPVAEPAMGLVSAGMKLIHRSRRALRAAERGDFDSLTAPETIPLIAAYSSHMENFCQLARSALNEADEPRTRADS